MNGRVYDYNLGRFMSADPFIQDPESSQSINPYSYIMNNPLAGTDPSGYLGCAASSIDATCAKLSNSEGGFKEQSAGMQAMMMGEKVVANAMSKIYANLNNGTHQQSASVNSTKSTTDMQSQSEVASRGGVGNSGTSGAVKSGPDDENSFVNFNRKGLDSALTKVNGLRDKLDPFETEEEAAVWLNDNAGNLQEKYDAEVGAIISKVYGEKTGWKIGDVVTSYHSNYVNLATSKIRAGKMDYIDTSVEGKSDWHTHSSGSHYASWGQDRDSHKSFYRAYVSSVGRSGKASLSLYNAPAARKEAWPLTRTAFDNANSCLVGGCR